MLSVEEKDGEVVPWREVTGLGRRCKPACCYRNHQMQSLTRRPCSIILATAQIHDAVLWTQDYDFKGLSGVRYFPVVDAATT